MSARALLTYVPLDGLAALGGVGKLDSQDFGVVCSWQQPAACWRFVRFGFNDCQCKVTTVAEQLGGSFAFTPYGGAARGHDAANREATLFGCFK